MIAAFVGIKSFYRNSLARGPSTIQASFFTSMINTGYTLSNKYSREAGRILLNGAQALMRLPVAQQRPDSYIGLTTVGNRLPGHGPAV